VYADASRRVRDVRLEVLIRAVPDGAIPFRTVQASVTSTPGCRKTLMTATPLRKVAWHDRGEAVARARG
jgi:hypothetical protein